MVLTQRLPRAFFAQPTLQVARELLGARLVRIEDGRRLAGYITEVEAYVGEEDLGCHARAGRTPRTRVMYGPPGFIYMFFSYGMHWMLNFVTEPEDCPAAVLIRGVFPCRGIDVIAARRSLQPRPSWANGPGKVCRSFNIDLSFNGVDMCSPKASLYVEKGIPIPDSTVKNNLGVTKGPRVGLNKVPEPWKSIPWRLSIQDIRPHLRAWYEIPGVRDQNF
jgi:DNA-3-methyladenine glycosylase